MGGKKVLIATLYSSEPVILATTKLGPDRLILLIDKKPDVVFHREKPFGIGVMESWSNGVSI